MSEKVLGIKEKEVNEAIRKVRKQEVENKGRLNVILQEEVLKELRKVFENMKKDTVPVVSLQALPELLHNFARNVLCEPRSDTRLWNDIDIFVKALGKDQGGEKKK